MGVVALGVVAMEEGVWGGLGWGGGGVGGRVGGGGGGWGVVVGGDVGWGVLGLGVAILGLEVLFFLVPRGASKK